jgi:hypothetical protein
MESWKTDVLLDNNQCTIAKEKYRDERGNGVKWESYVRVLGIATVAAAVVLIAAACLLVFGVQGLAANITAAVGAIGTVVGSSFILFVTRQRNRAHTNWNDALKDVAKYCGEDEVRKTLLNEESAP